MPIYWTPKLAVGVPQIDEEHQELFDRVNRLVAALAAAKAKNEVAPLIGFLSDYVKVHFAGEQALMRAHRYVGGAEHLQQHQFFVNEFEKLAKEFGQNGASGLLTIQLNKLLCDWLRDHVATTDRTFGAFLQSKGIGAEP
jgi:hemerythrin